MNNGPNFGRNGKIHGEVSFPEPADPNWRSKATCRDADPTLFFPANGIVSRAAQALCYRCPAAQDCLDFGVNGGNGHGVWGGYHGLHISQPGPDEGTDEPAAA